MTAFDDKTFYDAIRGELFGGSLSARQVQGTDAILSAWRDGYPEDDYRWLAYALATAYHETGRAMYPVPEGGRGKGHPYGAVANAAGQAAYGRGYVQLTWATNYKRADDELHLNGQLVANYDLALKPDIAAEILLRGMVEGWFTAFKLVDYLNDKLADYLHARRIVNGMDRAELIAGYAVKFATALVAAQRRAADTSAVAQSPTPTSVPHPAEAPASAHVAAPVAPAAPSAHAEFNPIGDLADALSQATGLPNLIAPAPPAPSSKPESDPVVTTAPSLQETIMNPITTAIGLIQIARSGFSVVSQYGTVVPTIVKDVQDIVAPAETAFKDLGVLVDDVKAGKYGDAASVDFPRLMSDIAAIVGKVTDDLTAVAGAINKTPTLPSVAGLKAASAA